MVNRYSQSRQGTSRQEGFTLVELMTVVAIIGVTAAMGYVYMNRGSTEKRVQGYTDRIAATFEMARERAGTTQKRQRIVFEKDNFSHWESVQTGIAEVADPNDPANWVFVSQTFVPDIEVSISAVSERIHIEADDSVPGEGTNLPYEIDLLPDGRARSDGATTFYEPGWTVFVGDDDSQERVLLFGLTGSATVYSNW